MPQIGTQKAVWSSSTDWAFVNNKGQDKNKTQAAAAFVKWMNDHSLAWAAGGELPAANKPSARRGRQAGDAAQRACHPDRPHHRFRHDQRDRRLQREPVGRDRSPAHHEERIPVDRGVGG